MFKEVDSAHPVTRQLQCKYTHYECFKTITGYIFNRNEVRKNVIVYIYFVCFGESLKINQTNISVPLRYCTIYHLRRVQSYVTQHKCYDCRQVDDTDQSKQPVTHGFQTATTPPNSGAMQHVHGQQPPRPPSTYAQSAQLSQVQQQPTTGGTGFRFTPPANIQRIPVTSHSERSVFY